jgi:hypothetical protein
VDSHDIRDTKKNRFSGRSGTYRKLKKYDKEKKLAVAAEET